MMFWVVALDDSVYCCLLVGCLVTALRLGNSKFFEFLNLIVLTIRGLDCCYLVLIELLVGCLFGCVL